VDGKGDLSPHAEVKVVDEERLADLADGLGGKEASEEAECEELDEGVVLVRGTST